MRPRLRASSLRHAAPDRAPAPPAIGLLCWGNVVEDFLDPSGLTLEQFRDEFTGSWMFGWARALATAGVETEIVVVSRATRATIHTTHRPTGAPLVILPASRAYRFVERRMAYAYGRSGREAFRWRDEPPRLRRAAAEVVREVAPYLATPPLLLARALRHGRWQALLCQEYEYPRFDVSVLIGRLARTPVFACFQGGRHRLGRLEDIARPASMALAGGLVVGSGAEAARVEARYGARVAAKVARIGNPVDTDRWRPRDGRAARAELGLAAEDRVVAWHGRVALHHKGLDVLLDAWRRLTAGGASDLRLLLVGGGEDAERVERLIADRSLVGIVRVDRHVHDPAELGRYLSAADVYAFASRYEGFPVAPLEAMACGLPLVATDVDGVRDLLPDGEASGGLVVPTGDATALADALGRLLGDAEQRRRLGANARSRARDHYSLQAVGAQLRTVLLGR